MYLLRKKYVISNEEFELKLIEEGDYEGGSYINKLSYTLDSFHFILFNLM